MEIINKNYEHYNRALGKYITNKRQYQDEMKRNGFVTQEEGNRLAEKHQEEKKWKPSKGCIEMIQSVKNLSKDGRIVLGQHQVLVDALKKKGMTFDIPKWVK
jgi:hypothetical protein